MENTHKEGVLTERRRWQVAFKSIGMPVGKRHASEVAQILAWRVEVAEEMALDIARQTVKACSQEGILDEKNVLANLNSLWQIYKDRSNEELGEQEEDDDQ